MPRFDRDTEVRRENGAWRARLSPDWDVWGPFGGYVAAIALRAMGAASELPRPASFHCAFLSVGRFGDVDLAVDSLRRGKRSEALHVRMTQEGRPVLAATGWLVDEGLSGLEHEHVEMPEVPGPGELRDFSQLADNYDEWFPIWSRRVLEGKPVVWDDAPRAPFWHAWMRIVDTPKLDDPILEAARNVLWMDMMMWNAAAMPHLPFPTSHIAPSLDLTVLFHDAAPEEEWLLCDAHSPVGREGLVGATGRVWTPGGRLLASGSSSLICRPNPALSGST